MLLEAAKAEYMTARSLHRPVMSPQFHKQAIRQRIRQTMRRFFPPYQYPEQREVRDLWSYVAKRLRQITQRPADSGASSLPDSSTS